MAKASFKYSDAEWHKIVTELPNKDKAWFEQHYDEGYRKHFGPAELNDEFCRHDSPHIRDDLECAGESFIGNAAIRNFDKESHKFISQIGGSAQQLTLAMQRYWKALGPYGEHTNSEEFFGCMPWHYDKASTDTFLAKLNDLIEWAEVQSERKPQNFFPAKDQARAFYFQVILEVWQDRGGTLATSNNAITGLPTGPLLRFMHAVVDPVYKAKGVELPTDPALRQIAEGKRRAQMANLKASKLRAMIT